jgi:hypothetical protein
MPHSEVGRRRDAAPAVDVDRDEDRLQEERESLQTEGQTEDAPEGGHEVGPQQAHLERQDHAGHHPDRKERDHHLGPAPRQRAVEVVTGSQVQRLDQQHHAGEGDAEAHQRDGHGEGQRLHLTRLVDVLLLDR